MHLVVELECRQPHERAPEGEARHVCVVELEEAVAHAQVHLED